MTRPAALALLALAAASLPAMAADAAPTAEVTASFEKAFAQARHACEHAASSVCADRTTALLDRNGDGGVERDELVAARDMAAAEAQRRQSTLSDSERGMVAIAVAAIATAGLDTVFKGFDTNHDGRIDRSELFADFKVGTRPFTEILGDPKAVDWQSFARRFGETGAMFLPLVRAGGSLKR